MRSPQTQAATRALRMIDDQRPRARWTPHPHEQAEVGSGYADPVALAGPTRNALDQDYARRSGTLGVRNHSSW